MSSPRRRLRVQRIYVRPGTLRRYGGNQWLDSRFNTKTQPTSWSGSRAGSAPSSTSWADLRASRLGRHAWTALYDGRGRRERRAALHARMPGRAGGHWLERASGRVRRRSQSELWPGALRRKHRPIQLDRRLRRYRVHSFVCGQLRPSVRGGPHRERRRLGARTLRIRRHSLSAFRVTDNHRNGQSPRANRRPLQTRAVQARSWGAGGASGRAREDTLDAARSLVHPPDTTSKRGEVHGPTRRTDRLGEHVRSCSEVLAERLTSPLATGSATAPRTASSSAVPNPLTMRPRESMTAIEVTSLRCFTAVSKRRSASSSVELRCLRRSVVMRTSRQCARRARTIGVTPAPLRGPKSELPAPRHVPRHRPRSRCEVAREPPM